MAGMTLIGTLFAGGHRYRDAGRLVDCGNNALVHYGVSGFALTL